MKQEPPEMPASAGMTPLLAIPIQSRHPSGSWDLPAFVDQEQ